MHLSPSFYQTSQHPQKRWAPSLLLPHTLTYILSLVCTACLSTHPRLSRTSCTLLHAEFAQSHVLFTALHASASQTTPDDITQVAQLIHQDDNTKVVFWHDTQEKGASRLQDLWQRDVSEAWTGVINLRTEVGNRFDRIRSDAQRFYCDGRLTDVLPSFNATHPIEQEMQAPAETLSTEASAQPSEPSTPSAPPAPTYRHDRRTQQQMGSHAMSRDRPP